MAVKATLAQVLTELQGWHDPQEFNLVVLLVPAAQAWSTRQRLIACWSNTVDFDAEVIAKLVASDWSAALAAERAGRGEPLRTALRQVTDDLADRVGSRPLVVTDVNLPLLADWDAYGQQLYVASAKGLVVLAVVGRVEDGRVCLHGRCSILAEDCTTVVELQEEP